MKNTVLPLLNTEPASNQGLITNFKSTDKRWDIENQVKLHEEAIHQTQNYPGKFSGSNQLDPESCWKILRTHDPVSSTNQGHKKKGEGGV